MKMTLYLFFQYGCRPLLCAYLCEEQSKEGTIEALMEACPADIEEIYTVSINNYN